MLLTIISPKLQCPKKWLPLQVANSPVNEKKSSKMPLVALLVIVIVLSAGFGYYYLQTSTQISNLNGQNITLSGKLSAANTNLNSDQNQISMLNSNISTLQTNISVNKQDIASLQTSVQSDNNTIGSLNVKALALDENISELKGNLQSEQSQVSSLNTQIGLLQSNQTSDLQQISQIQGQIASDNSSISGLQTQVNSLTGITSMSESTVEFSGKQVTIPQSGYVSVVNFTSSYPGYIVVNAPSASKAAVAETVDQITSSTYSITDTLFTFSYSSTTVILPVGPGQISVIFVDQIGSTTGMTITYYY
jgi:hypothetical protein